MVIVALGSSISNAVASRVGAGVPGPWRCLWLWHFRLGYSGRVPLSSQWLAAKILETDSVAEVAALQALKHPNIVELLHVCRYKGKLALVFEAADLDLQRFLRTRARPLAAGVSMGIAGQVAAGISYIHDMQWMHRDLKPSNILVRFVDTPGLSPQNILCQIADFGSAKELSAGGRGETVDCVLWTVTGVTVHGESAW